MQKNTNINIKDLSGSEIVSLIKTNDGQTLKRLYITNFRKVKKYVLKNNGDDAAAKDVYQEAFVAMWHNIKDDKFSSEDSSSVNGYLYRIAKNKWLDHLRSARYKRTSSIEKTIKVDAPEIMETDEKNQKIKILLESMEKMGERCQTLLKLFYFERKSFREIAEITGMDEASARNAKYRCQKQLKKITEEIPNP